MSQITRDIKEVQEAKNPGVEFGTLVSKVYLFGDSRYGAYAVAGRKTGELLYIIADGLPLQEGKDQPEVLFVATKKERFFVLLRRVVIYYALNGNFDKVNWKLGTIED